jgi:hypothetical protein
LTATHPIKPTSTRCPSAWQPNPRQRLHLAMRKICSENRDHYIPERVLQLCLMPLLTIDISFLFLSIEIGLLIIRHSR